MSRDVVVMMPLVYIASIPYGHNANERGDDGHSGGNQNSSHLNNLIAR